MTDLWAVSASPENSAKASRSTATATAPALTIAEGSLFLDFTGGKYRFHITIPAMPGKMTRNNIRRPSGYCDAKSNEPQDSNSEWSEEIGRMTIEMNEGVLDPKNPDVIEGSRSYTESGGDEMEIRWSLRNCR